MTEPRPVRAIGSIEQVRVADAMHVGLIACPADTPLTVIAEKMSQEAVHCILIRPDPESDEGEWRVVSDLDLMGGLEEPDTPAGRIAASPLMTVSEDDSVLRAVRLMHEYQAAHLLVVSDGGPSGVISTFDVASVLARIGRQGPDGAADAAEGREPRPEGSA